MDSELPVKLGREIGKGANSTVYEVATIAPSLLPPAQDGSARVAKVTACESEEQSMRVFAKTADVRDVPRHPGVAAYDLVLPGVPREYDVCAVMRRYAGDLGQYMARRRGRREDDGVATATVLAIGEQLAAALAHLHAHGVWHLDVSFGNVLVSDLDAREPHAVIVDLENSRVNPATDAPSADFTADFAAPERSSLDKCGAKCDVFSLAVMLYALATCAEFPGLVDGIPGLGAGFLSRPEMTPARVAAVLHRDMPSSPQLAALLVTALSHDPATRISMDHFSRALRTLRAGGSLAFPEVLPPLRVRLAAGAEALRGVIVNRAASVFDVNTPCCVCGNVRHVALKHRTDCVGGALHLPGSTCPGSSRGPQALLGSSTSEVAGGLAFHFLYPLVPEAATASPGMGSPAASTPTPEPSAPRMAADSAATDDGFVPVVDSGPLLNALQLHGGFAIAAVHAQDATDRFTNPKALMVIDGSSAASASNRNAPTVRLAFTAPQPWPSECTAQLQRDGRFHSPIPALLGTTQDARAFAWVRPGESFTLANGERWEPAPEGGFVFLFGSGDDPTRVAGDLDRFFAVAAVVAASGSSVSAATAAATAAAKRATTSVARGFGAFVRDFCVGVDRAIRPQPQPAAEAAAPQPPLAEAESQPSLREAPATPPPAPTRPLPIAIYVTPIPVRRVSIDRTASRWRCATTSEDGDVGHAIPVAAAVVSAMQLPPETTCVRLLHRCGFREAPLNSDGDVAEDDSPLFPHNGIAAFKTRELDGCVAVCALNVSVGLNRSSSAAGDDQRRKLPLLLPSEGHVSAAYRGVDAPAQLAAGGPGSDGAASGQGLEAGMMGLAPPPDTAEDEPAPSLDFFLADASMTTWHVRRLRQPSRFA